MKEASMTGTIRRAITRADEDEVRRRVAPLGYPVSVDAFGVLHIDRFVTKDLATAGIFPGPDGWEIEGACAAAVRRKLPPPWAWFEDGDTEKLARSQAEVDEADWIASAHVDSFVVYGGTTLLHEDKASSPADARERAEDECWSRGLFGVSDAPEGDESDSDDAGPPSSRPLPLSDPSADPAARALRALIARVACCDASGWIAQPQGETVQQKAAAIGRLCDSFVAELRATTKPREWVTSEEARGFLTSATAKMAAASIIAEAADRPARDRQFAADQEAARAWSDGSAALSNYLTEHHADTWKANETAGAFAVRLLRSADDTIETLRREADGADAARAVVATERDTFREEARRLREQVGALDRELASAREGARGLGVTCQAAQEARDVYQKRAEAAEGKLVYARGEIEAMADQVARLTQLLSPKVDA